MLSAGTLAQIDSRITQADGLFYDMGRVFASDFTGALVYVHSHDHCSPHVHALHRSEGWMARVGFSYVDCTVELTSVAPTDHPPARHVLNALLAEVKEHLVDCREAWWMIQKTTGLANRWSIARAPGLIELLPVRKPGARQIADSRYDPATLQLHLTFVDGSKLEMTLQT
jgi:hypothetical protein